MIHGDGAVRSQGYDRADDEMSGMNILECRQDSVKEGRKGGLYVPSDHKSKNGFRR